MGEGGGVLEMMICRKSCCRGCGRGGARGTERRLEALPGQAGVTNKCRGRWGGRARRVGRWVRVRASPREEGTIYRAPTRAGGAQKARAMKDGATSPVPRHFWRPR